MTNFGIGAIVWAAGENRLVAGGGDLDGRFKAADADGFAFGLGALARFVDGHAEVGAGYELVRFGWTFEPVDAMPTYIATGGSDLFHTLRFWLGGAY